MPPSRKTTTAKRRVGRPKEVDGELVTCTFELTTDQSAYLSMQANAVGASRSHVLRSIIDAVIERPRRPRGTLQLEIDALDAEKE